MVDSPVHPEGAVPLDAHQRLQEENNNNSEELLYMKKLLVKYYSYGFIFATYMNIREPYKNYLNNYS